MRTFWLVIIFGIWSALTFYTGFKKPVLAAVCCASDGTCPGGTTCSNCPANMSCACPGYGTCIDPNAIPTTSCSTYGQQCGANGVQSACCSGYICNANTCQPIPTSTPVPAGVTPISTAPAVTSCSGWCTNAGDTCQAHGLPTASGTCSNGGQCCGTTTVVQSCGTGCCDSTPVSYMNLTCLTNTSQLRLDWQPSVDTYSCISHGVSLVHSPDWWDPFYSQNFAASASTTTLSITNTSAYQDYTVSTSGTQTGTNISWAAWYNPITSKNSSQNGDRSFSCTDRMGRVIDKSNKGIPGVLLDIYKCSTSGYCGQSGTLVTTETTDSSGYYYVPYGSVFPGAIATRHAQDAINYGWVETSYAVFPHDTTWGLVTPSGGTSYSDQNTKYSGGSSDCAYPSSMAAHPYSGLCNFTATVSPPTFTDLTINNVNGTTSQATSGVLLDGALVNPENVSGVGVSVNQICDSSFANQTNNSRDVSFRINVSDATKWQDIQKVALRMSNGGNSLTVWMNNVGAGQTSPGALTLTIDPASTTSMASNVSFYGNNNPPIINALSSTSVMAVIPLRFTKSFPSALYNLQVYAIDTNGILIPGSTSGWVDSGREFKVWNCGVATQGTIYDASGSNSLDVQACAASAFTTVYTNPHNLANTLDFAWTANLATIVPATITNNALYATNSPLTWGQSFQPTFNTNFDLPGPIGRVNGGQACIGTGPINLAAKDGSGAYLVNPYANLPTLQLDFAGIRNQDSWYQVVGGGVQSDRTLYNAVPVTCSVSNSTTPGSCIPAVSISSTGNLNSGLVAGKSGITNTNGCSSSQCFNGYPDPERNWSINGTNISTVPIMDYNKLISQLYFQSGIGTTMIFDSNPSANTLAWQTISGDTNQVVFVDTKGQGLLINANLVLPANDYIVIIVNGNVTIDPSVSRLDGIYISTGAIGAAGQSPTDNQLVINGSLFGKTLSFTRSYTTASLNNTQPAVKINYQPGYMVLLPQKVFRNIGAWSQGAQ